MRRFMDRRRGRDSGFTLLELLVVVAIISVIAMIAIPVYINALRSSHRAALVGEANGLFKGIMRYHVDESQFPPTSSPPEEAFDRVTLEPLVSKGYIRDNTMVQKLLNDQITGYDSPDVGGVNTQFWAVLTMDYDPDVQVLVASTNQYPGHSGTWYEGLYYIQGSTLEKVQ
jgi:prepilin-type N-terminal cleavage/methylation domain-containing protein